MYRQMLLLVGVLLGAAAAWAYPNGTPHYVTDMVPACASCHSILDAAVMPDAPQELAVAELAKNKHLGALRSGAFPTYFELDAGQREALAAEVEKLDAEASVTVTAVAEAAPGADVSVRVAYTGGNGPVVGIMLVDRPLRNQARPVQSGGWLIRDVIAATSDGKDASSWFSHRVEPRQSNLNFVLLPAARADGAPPPSGSVTFRLRAPADPGTYPLTAVFLYGTENTDRAGFFQRPSGRTLFSKSRTVTVR